MNQRLTPTDPGVPAADAATHWMARKMSGSMNAEERRQFEDWLARAPENKRAFAEVEALLGRTDALAEELLTEEFLSQMNAAAENREGRKRAGFGLIAASLVAVASLATVATFIRLSPRQTPAIAYETQVGESEKITLEDGSEIELNTASHIAVAFNDATRSVEIKEGEAFFNVEKDRSRPFIVKTALAEVAVTGTSFSVSTLGDRSSVHVLTGVVEVTPREGQAATLLAGDTIEIDADGSSSGVRRYDPSLVFAWRNGKARFQDEPLAKVVASLNRYFETPIVLGDKTLADLPVTGEFDIRDRETAVEALALVFGLDRSDEPARTILSQPDAQ